MHLIEHYSIDIVLLQEIWNRPPPNIEGYKTIWNTRLATTIGGGTGIIYRDSIPLKHHGQLSSNFAGEPEAIAVSTASLLIVNMYLPPGCINVTKHMDRLDAFLFSLPQRVEVVIGGDVNIEIFRPSFKTTRPAQRLLDILSSFNVHPRINATTRNERSIDNFFTTRVMDRVLVVPTKTSDHSVVILEFTEPSTRSCIPKVNSRRIDMKEYTQGLDQIVQTATSFNQFHIQVTELIRRLSPTSLPCNIPNHVPFFDKELKGNIKCRNSNLRKYQKTRSAADRAKYIESRNLVKLQLRSKRKSFWRDHFEEIGDVELFRTYHALLGSNSLRKCQLDTEMINEYNKYFAQLGCSETAAPVEEHNLRQPIESQLYYLHNITAEELRLAARELVNTSAPGGDFATAQIVKITVDRHADRMLGYFNSSLDEGEFPTVLKSSIVVPIPKKNSSNPEDHRPVSLTSMWSKLFEKCLKLQLTTFTESRLDRTQYGFRRNLHCEAALLRVTDLLLSALDHNHQGILILFDFSKAFDSVDHKLLAAKLEGMGLAGRSHAIIEDFLTNRTQQLRIDGQVSTETEVFRGVPQGSVLGPMLFNLYINDLKREVRNCDIILYADDLQLVFTTGKMDMAAAELLQTDLDSIHKWTKLNGLKMNLLKTKALHYTRDHSDPPSLKFGSDELTFCTSARNLGIIFDHKLGFTAHVDKVIRVARWKLFKMRSIQPF